MISTPSTNDKASIARNAFQLPVNMNTAPRPSVSKPSTRLTMCCPAKTTGAPWNKRNLKLPDNLPNAITEPLKVIAPMAAPRNNSNRLPTGISSVPVPGPVIPNAAGSTTAATAMNTAAKPIMLCMKATSSGILVISTRWAMTVPAPPPTTRASKTQPRPWTGSTCPNWLA